MKLSILIRNLNESKQLKQTLTALKRQVVDFEYEVIVIDNQSDDDSITVAKAMGCEVFTLKRNEFTYGRALNFGIKKCSGEIILMLSAHVILLNEFFLKNIPSYFENKTIAGLRFVQATSTVQVADAIEKGAQYLSYCDEADFAYKNWTRFIINHCAAIRRSCLDLQLFDETLPDSEDKDWSVKILKKGYSILYNVPCFYLYNKEIRRKQKIRSHIHSYYAKKLVTGREEKLFAVPYVQSMWLRLIKELRGMKVQMLLHHHIYRGLKRFHKSKLKEAE